MIMNMKQFPWFFSVEKDIILIISHNIPNFFWGDIDENRWWYLWAMNTDRRSFTFCLLSDGASPHSCAAHERQSLTYWHCCLVNEALRRARNKSTRGKWILDGSMVRGVDTWLLLHISLRSELILRRLGSGSGRVCLCHTQSLIVSDGLDDAGGGRYHLKLPTL